MSWLERSTVLQALRAVLVYVWYLSDVRALADSGALAGPDGLERLGWQMLQLIGVTVLAGIVVQILAVIVTTATGQEAIADMEDERDRQIEARATGTGFAMAGFGFVSGILALWQGWGAVWAFNLVLAGMVAADVAVNLLKFIRYWRGG